MADVASFESFLKFANSNVNAGSELNAMTAKILKAKQDRDDDAQTHADMYSALQQTLVKREEEINSLKHLIKKIGGVSTPTEDSSLVFSETTPVSELNLKLKIRELMSSLKTITEQRDNLQVKFENLQNSESRKNEKDGYDELEQKHRKLERELLQQINAQSVLKSLVQSLRDEKESAIAENDKLSLERENHQSEVAQLKDQIAHMFHDVTILTDESEKMRSQIIELKDKNKVLNQSQNNNIIEQMRQESRETHAGFEFRISTLQQKLEKSEQTCSSLNEQLAMISKVPETKRKDEIMNLVPLVDPKELQAAKSELEEVEKLNFELKLEISAKN